jgi:hypothetical protein
VSAPSDEKVVGRAAAYDDVYARWTPKHVSVESFERW